MPWLTSKSWNGVELLNGEIRSRVVLSGIPSLDGIDRAVDPHSSIFCETDVGRPILTERYEEPNRSGALVGIREVR